MICPRCSQDVVPQPVGFTWWGGLVGAKLIHHVECPACRARFHGKTGRDNTANIVLYVSVVAVVFGALVYFLLTAM